MAGFYKLVGSLSWWLSVLCLILGFLTKLVKRSGIQVFWHRDGARSAIFLWNSYFYVL